MGGELVGDDAYFYIVFIRQSEVFLRRDVAEHGAAIPTNHGGTDAGSDMTMKAELAHYNGQF